MEFYIIIRNFFMENTFAIHKEYEYSNITTQWDE